MTDAAPRSDPPHPERRVAALVLGAFVVLSAALVWIGGGTAPSTVPMRASKVVIVAVSPLGWDDLRRGMTPALDELTRTAAVGSLSVRTASRVPSSSEGFLSVGGGGRLDTGCDDDHAVSCDVGVAYEADARVGAGTAADLHAARIGRRVDGGVVAPGAVRTRRVNSGADGAGRPGALGDALAEAGLVAAVVGNADQPATVNTRGRLDRAATLAVVDGDFHVPVGTVQRALLRREPSAPFGVTINRAALLDAVDDAVEQADVVVVDPGELTRAERFAPLATPEVAGRRRDEALRTTDAIVADLRGRLPAGTALLVLAVEPPQGALTVTPLLIAAPGAPAGWLASSSTKRQGVVAIGDLAPTVLGLLGVDRPDDLPGAAVSVEPALVDLRQMSELARDTQHRERTYGPQSLMFVVATVALCVVSSIALGRRPSRRPVEALDIPVGPRLESLLRLWALAVAAAPLTGFVVWMIPDVASWGPAVALVGAGIALVIAAIAARDQRHPLAPLAWIEVATLVVIVGDVATGANLHLSSWLGYSLHGGGRFYGIPNTTFAVLGAAALVTVAGLAAVVARRRVALAAAAGVLGLVVIVDGAPMLGGDVGGIVTLVPVFGATWLVLSGRRVRVRSVGLIGAIGLVAVVAAALLDLSRPVASRTHLGRFAARVTDDPAALWDTVARKQSANVRILQGSIWTWVIPAAAVLIAWVVVGAGRWRTLLPSGSWWRVATLAIAASAMLGFATNDSGPIVVSLFAVPIITIVVLATLDHRHRGDRDGPQLRHA